MAKKPRARAKTDQRPFNAYKAEWERKKKESRGKTLLKYGTKLLRQAAVENVLKLEAAQESA
jgi:hypothetical protein